MSLGWVATHRGELKQATALEREALRLFWALGNKRRCAEAFESLAMTAAVAGEAQWSARLLGVVAGVRETIGAPQSEALRKDMDQTVVGAQVALGEETWAAAFAAGQALSLEEAIAEALQSTL
jgi:hypothetical protein